MLFYKISRTVKLAMFQLHRFGLAGHRSNTVIPILNLMRVSGCTDQQH